MKKLFLTLVLCLALLMPFKTLAANKYETMNLDEVLTQESIEHDFSNYKETADQITIYIFRGNGCGYCHRLFEFLNSIVDEYGKYFKVVSYETWYNRDNYNFMIEISNFLGSPATGVPYVIIGDQVFPGYASSYDDKIKETIKELYNTKKDDRYDVIKEYEKSKKNSNNTSSNINLWMVIGINGGIVLIVAIAIIYIMNGENKTLYKKLSSIENEIIDLKNYKEKAIVQKEEKEDTKITKSKAKKTTKK